eukprot:NODE_71_length_23666_cov_0.239403.p9 type:complete len:262 gc:universal NODE_71_length_23666_cov_0.239403:9016-9801(+)
MESDDCALDPMEVELQILNYAYQKHYEAFQKQLIVKETEFHKSLNNLWIARSEILQKYDKSIWYNCFCNHPVLRNYINEEDEKVFAFIYDIELLFIQGGFELHFKFKPNTYLKELLVIKQYKYISDDAEKDDSFLDITKLPIDLPAVPKSDIPGVQFENTFTTPVSWTTNILTKTINKKQRNKHTNQVRVLTTEIVLDSFFHYFEDHGKSSRDPELSQIDIDIADAIKDDVIPNLYIWYVGDNLDGNDLLTSSMDQLDINN